MQINLFAEETQLQRLSEPGDSLEKLNVIDLESFRPLLEKVNCKERKSKAGRPSLESQGIITHTGTIVDATFVDAPR